MAVTTQESFGWIREKAMRIACFDSSSGGAEKDRNKKVNEVARGIVGLMTREKKTGV